MKQFKDPRLNQLIGRPERIVVADESATLESGLLEKFGRREQIRLERDLAAQTLAQLLVQARADSGLTVRKAADLLGRHPSRIGAIERGDSALAFRTFVDYAQAMGYDIEIKLMPNDPSRAPLSAVLAGDSQPEEPAPSARR